MGWLLVWVGLAVVVALLWFSPYLRRRARPVRPGGQVDGTTEAGVRGGEQAQGLGGWGHPRL